MRSRSAAVALNGCAGTALVVVLTVALVSLPAAQATPRPTDAQLRLMDMGLAQFMHFSLDPWSQTVQHNCVGSPCIPANKFNPSNLSTDQWVQAAVAMGAGEICLTAHHEGGFCLWDTAYSNYSVMHTPYGRDVVKQFVKSCKKYGVRPCYYMGPNSNGYLMQQNYSADEFVTAQLGMLKELLTEYGTDYVGRLWWDHWPGGCNSGLSQCPTGSFPGAWPQFTQLVRQLSPSTIICPGPDCDGHQGETGTGKYPSWFPCTPDAGGETCNSHQANDSLAGFHPYETCTSLHNGWFARGNGTAAAGNSYWTAQDIWDHYMMSVGIGWVNTLNAPPGTTGQLDPVLVESMGVFGDALRQLLRPVAHKAVAENATLTCAPGLTTSNFVELDLGKGAARVNAVMMREDLSRGQAVSAYEIDLYTSEGGWQTVPKCGLRCSPDGRAPQGAIPSVPRGSCGGTEELSSAQLTSDGTQSRFVRGVSSADGCQAACSADATCNFWTWSNRSGVGLVGDVGAVASDSPDSCSLVDGGIYSYRHRGGYYSGVCNHTLPNPGSVEGYGVHGMSVGARMIDLLPANSTLQRARFRCTESLRPDAAATLRSFSLHYGLRPQA